MPATIQQHDVQTIRDTIWPIDSAEDAATDHLIDSIGDCHYVLLGEATHGTHEFYAARAAITKRLIEEKEFNAVAVEADWPDAYRVNRYVQGRSDDDSPEHALGEFQRFPTWMWRNDDVVALAAWLRQHNASRRPEQRIGFYGLDLYSLYSSIDAVITYLDEVDPEAAQRARERYGCFDHATSDPQRYGHAASIGARPDCRDQAVQQLIELRQRAADYLRRDGMIAQDEQFFAEQNAIVIAGAETYYRAMFGGRANTWNLRDTHMARTLEALSHHLARQNRTPRLIVWAHNSHLGDARATEMSQRGELNLGQLTRQTHGDDAYLLGFTTATGTVSAASDWGADVERKTIRPPLENSYEALLHAVDQPRFILPMRSGDANDVLREERLERAIGVIYRPETERWSHYFHTNLPQQFDAIIHFDESQALHPLEKTQRWMEGESPEVPETYPTGL